MPFSDNIKSVRLTSLLTQEQFAYELGVSFATVNRWETGKSIPNLKAMKQIDCYCKQHSIDYDICEEIFKCHRATVIREEV